jgi:hypothetical protein
MPRSAILQQLRRAAYWQEWAELTDGELLECFLIDRDEAAFETLGFAAVEPRPRSWRIESHG